MLVLVKLFVCFVACLSVDLLTWCKLLAWRFCCWFTVLLFVFVFLLVCWLVVEFGDIAV